MSQVFISYARPSERQADTVAAVLRERGYEIWRDDQLPAHRAFAEVIEERLAQAKAVLVLWTADAVQSQWVRAEADAARNAGKLVQASGDGTQPPMPFNQIQCADLDRWDGDASAPGWRKVEASIAALAGAPPEAKPAPLGHAVSVCVLPFANMSGDPEQEYFSDGISEDITTDLSKVSALQVIARNTAFTFKGKAVHVGDIARQLGVSHVLEGSVRKAGNRVRITAQLIDGASGGHVWAERYDRELTDIFAIQDEISTAIVEALKVKLLPAEKKAIEHRGTSIPAAYDLFLMARQAWIVGDFGDRRREEKVIRICQRAIEIDPRYGQVWALMALAQANLRYGFSSRDTVDDGTAAARRAIAIDPDIAEAYLPIAWHLAEQRRHAEADTEIAVALRLGPDSWEVHKEAARLFYRQQRLEEAARHLEIATAIMPTDFHGFGMLFGCYSGLKREDEALHTARRVVDETEKVIAADPDNGAAIAFGAVCLAALGDDERGHRWIERGLLVDPDNLMMRYNFGWGLNRVFGDRDAAIEMLRPVMANAGANIIRLAAYDPNLDEIRDDPRFAAMIAEAKARVGLATAEADAPLRS